MNGIRIDCRTARTAVLVALLSATGLTPLTRGQAMIADKGSMAFHRLEKVAFRFGGPVGERVQANLDHWLLPAPDANPGMLEMFRLRDTLPPPGLVPWAGEFAGKYLISAVQALRMTDAPRLRPQLAEFVRELIGTQADDGYLGPWPRNQRLLGQWDLWGHYHVLLGLVMWYEDTGDREAMAAARSGADLVCRTFLDTGRRPLQAGSDEMNLGIIHVLCRLYRHTDTQRYLDMARMVEEDWATPPAGDYFRQGLADVPFYRLPRHRWESLHTIQGMVELYRISGDDRYRQAFTNLWQSIADHDLHNTGAFSTNEEAVGSPFRLGAVETCCHVAWQYMSEDMLALTADPAVADELERGFWNATLGYQHPSGRWSTYHTPPNGHREASAHSIVFQARAGTPELNCCSVNAPRGLGMLSEWAVMSDAEGGLVVNWYGPLEVEGRLRDGRRVRLVQETEYPADGRVTLRIAADDGPRLRVRLRIPGWCRAPQARLNGSLLPDVRPGAYLDLDRDWAAGDTVTLDLDMPLRTWVGGEAREGRVSLYRGPLLLTYDQAYNRDRPEADPPRLDLERLEESEPQPVPPVRFPPIVLLRFPTQTGGTVALCDFASAGAHGTEYASWLPVEDLPPGPFRLREPDLDEQVAAGPVRFSWEGSVTDREREYRLTVAADRELTTPLAEVTGIRRHHVLLGTPELPVGRPLYWQVTATNRDGQTPASNGPASFELAPGLPNLYLEHPGLVRYREDGTVTASPLDGTGAPDYGFLETERGVSAAPDRRGKAAAAMHFAGGGMLRYRIPEFPHPAFTVALWARIAPGQAEGNRQIFCAWQAPVHDPLRLVCHSNGVLAAIESPSGTVGTPVVPVPYDTWIHLAVTRDADRLALFVNGEPAAEAFVPPGTIEVQADDFALGGNPHYSGDEYLHGDLDDFVFMAHALDADGIRRLMGQP